MIEPVVLTEYPNNEWFEKCRAEWKSEVFYVLSVPHSDVSKMLVIALADTVNSIWSEYHFKFAVVTTRNNYRFDGPLVSKEEWLDGMAADYLEWFLWHPEHLE